MKGVIELLGGGAKIFAAIAVSFPEGSTCTCSKDGKVITAKNTGGKWIFQIPEAGTWVVAATDGKESASQEVVISAAGETAKVELEYRDYVIHNGILKADFNISTSTATYEVVNGALVFKSTKASSGNGNINIYANGNNIDMTKRAVLKFDTEAISPRNGKLDYVKWSVSGAASVTKYLGINDPVERQIVSIDISNVSSGYINMFISDNPATVELKIYDAWFE